jgi:hypothetical protein
MRFIQQHLRCYRKSLAAVVVLIFGGCTGAEGPDTVAVTGTVTVNGSPLEGASVTFHPIEGSENVLASQAVTDAAGRFRLATHVGGGRFKDGIVPGKYSVVVTKLDTAAISSTLAPPKNLLPEKYDSPTTSGLSAEVSADKENDFKFSINGGL